MTEYQVIARRFRPQAFKEVLGQEAIVTTLKNAIKFKRVAQAYLFCGSRGTGKTTLARIFAKALNCQELTNNFEPCNQCSSCREITSGSSLDVLEIDGASHRGIEDIRQINETVGYAASSGGYKIYIIDEVHMLTKEAFNALLKTLEEPPPKVKFFFATTEPHKVLPTILSRCQRFNLNRISFDKIVQKLNFITNEMGIEVEPEALRVLAQQAEGGLRDAESLLDQILSFEEGKLTVDSVNAILGLMSTDAYFEIDRAGKEGNFAKAFEIAHAVFAQGKDLMHFVDGLIEHLRTILLIKLAGKETPFLTLTEKEKERYEASVKLYTQEQCLNLLEELVDTHQQFRFASSGRIALESLILHVMRSHFQIPIEFLVRRLSELEKSIDEPSSNSEELVNLNPSTPAVPLKPVATTITAPAPVKQPVIMAKAVPPSPPKAQAQAQPQVQVQVQVRPQTQPAASLFDKSMSEDPTPSLADLGMKKAKMTTTTPTVTVLPDSSSIPFDETKRKPTHQYDTIFHFAAVELEGKLQRNL